MADYTNTRGIFALLDVRERQGAGVWSERGDVWNTPSPFAKTAATVGYFGGGATPSKVKTVDRIDYSNDTATAVAKGPLAGTFGAMVGRGATGSSTFGYVGGGNDPFGKISLVSRLSYFNDTANAVAKGPLSAAKKYLAATGNNSFGYFAAGETPASPGSISTVDRINYANDDVIASPKGPLSAARNSLFATGNLSFGYFAGGMGNPLPPYQTTIERTDYSNDTATASPKGPLTVGRQNAGATGNAEFGYLGGGNIPGNNSSVVDRVDYSNDTVTAPSKGPLSLARGFLDATGNASFGYWGGGHPNPYSTVDRVDYSNDTATAVAKGPLTQARYDAAGFSPKANSITDPTIFPATQPRDNVVPQGTDFGYYDRGFSPPNPQLQRIDFSNDTATATGRGPTTPGIYRSAAVSSASHGYFAGGQDTGGSTPNGISSVDRLDYSNDSAAKSPKGPLTATKYASAGTGNVDFGYIAGGNPGINFTIVDRIDYSNDTATASARGNLSSPHRFYAAMGNQSFGYFAGNWSNGSRVDRVDYSNDTATSVEKGNMVRSSEYGFTAGTGNANFGYIGGGGFAPNVSFIDRIDYSNDTATAVARGPLSFSKYGMAAMGNADFGYWSGGQPGSSTTVDRLDYSNDTATASPKGPLTQAKSMHSGSSSRMNGNPLKGIGVLELPVAFGPFIATQPQVGFNNGYFSGGSQPANSPSFPSTVEYSSVARIDYSNDTTTVPARGSLTDVRYSHAGTGNSNFGYHGGGAPYSPSASDYKTSIERIDYSNDTATASLKGNLSVAKTNQGATGNVNFGYYAGGTPGTVSTVQRIDYGNDTATASPKGPLSLARYSLSSTGNQSFGYNIGGYNHPAPVYIRSTIDRIDYSNDTATAVAKGPLSVQRDRIGSTGNADFGYAAGGYNVVPGGNNWVSLIDRIDYSNDTATASPKGPLSRTRGFGCATGDSSFGYFGGGEGNNNENLSALDRLDYSNDTATTVDKGPLSYSLRNSAASSSLANANPPFSPATINYPEGTVATSNSGYFVAGSPGGGDLSVLDRMDYANDTATAVARGPLSLARRQLGATSNGSSGYAGGGVIHPSPAVSTVDRFDYVNDFSTTLVKGPLAAATRQLGATGNENFGYYGGGTTPSGIVSTVHRSNQRYLQSSGTVLIILMIVQQHQLRVH